MPLTDSRIRQAAARDSEWKLFDGKGLYLAVTPAGSKLWRLKYRLNGKEKKLSIGPYPEVSLKEARQRRTDARRQVDSGIDPSLVKQAEKRAAVMGANNNFASIADEYLDKMEKEGKAPATLAKARWLLSKLRPALGHRPIADISPQELLAVLKKEETAGRRETARRLRSFAGRIFRYAVATARASHDPSHLLRDALVAPVAKHHAAITDSKELGALLRAIDAYSGQPASLFALRLTPHVFQRPGEIRRMEWSEIDLEAAVWTIPAGRKKQREPHCVPLSRQSLQILREVQGLTGHWRYVFPSLRTRSRPMSENTVNGALRRLGYGGDEMTAHGFRSTASTLLNESGKWNPDAIERALSRAEKNQIRAAHHRSAYWNERVAMAQWWSDYLDRLRHGADVVLRSRANS